MKQFTLTFNDDDLKYRQLLQTLRSIVGQCEDCDIAEWSDEDLLEELFYVVDTTTVPADYNDFRDIVKIREARKE